MTMDDKRLREEAYSRLRIWRDGCREMHERAKEARSILLLQDPRQDAQTASRRKDKRTLQLQTLKSTFNNCGRSDGQYARSAHAAGNQGAGKGG